METLLSPQVPTPAPVPVSTKSFFTMYKWPLVALVGLILLSLMGWWWFHQAAKVEAAPISTPMTTSKVVAPSLLWATKTRDIFPIGSTVTLQSTDSNKYLCFKEVKDALPVDPLASLSGRSSVGLVLEASETDASNTICHWQVLDLDPSQRPELQGIAIRLKNVAFETFLREIELPPESPTSLAGFRWESGPGPLAYSPMLAKTTEYGTLLVGGHTFLLSGNTNIDATSPLLLRSDKEGHIAIPEVTPVAAENPFWKVTKIN